MSSLSTLSLGTWEGAHVISELRGLKIVSAALNGKLIYCILVEYYCLSVLFDFIRTGAVSSTNSENFVIHCFVITHNFTLLF